MSVDVSPASIDVELMWELFARFVAADTGARVGENRIPPEDERLGSFARDVAAPTLAALGAEVAIDELNNVVGRFGEDRGSELLLVSYSALHHGNEMDDPLRARRERIGDDERWTGLGAGQGKAAFAGVVVLVLVGLLLLGLLGGEDDSGGGQAQKATTAGSETAARRPARTRPKPRPSRPA